MVVDGVDTNVELFARLLERPELATYTIDTGWLERIADKVAVDRPTVVAASSHGSVVAPLLGTVVSIGASPGQAVAAGDELVVLEAMKMEHVVTAPSAGSITSVDIEVGWLLDLPVFSGVDVVIMVAAQRHARFERFQ